MTKGNKFSPQETPIVDIEDSTFDAALSSSKKEANPLEKNISEAVIKKTLEKINEVEKTIGRDLEIVAGILINSDVWEGAEQADIQTLFFNSHNSYYSIVALIESQSEMINNLLKAGRELSEKPSSEFLEHYNHLAEKIVGNKNKLEELSSSLKLISKTLPDQSSKQNNKGHYKSYVKITLNDVNDFVSGKLAGLITIAEPATDDDKATNERINFIYDLYPPKYFNSLVTDFTESEEDLLQYKKDLANSDLSIADLASRDNARDFKMSDNLSEMFVLKTFFDVQPELVPKLKEKFSRVEELNKEIEKLSVNSSVETIRENYETTEHIREVIKDRILNDADPFDSLGYLDDKIEDLEDKVQAYQKGVSGKIEVKDMNLKLSEARLEEMGVFAAVEAKINSIRQEYDKKLPNVKRDILNQINKAVEKDPSIAMDQYINIAKNYLDRYKKYLQADIDKAIDRAEIKADIKSALASGKKLEEDKRAAEKKSIPASPSKLLWERSGDFRNMMELHNSLFAGARNRIAKINPSLESGIQSDIDKIQSKVDDYVNANIDKMDDMEIARFVGDYLAKHAEKFIKLEKALEEVNAKEAIKEIYKFEDALEADEVKEAPPSPVEVFLDNNKELKSFMENKMKVYDSIRNNIILMNTEMAGSLDDWSAIIKSNIQGYLIDNNLYNDYDNPEVVSWIKNYLEESLKKLRRFEKLEKSEQKKKSRDINNDLKKLRRSKEKKADKALAKEMEKDAKQRRKAVRNVNKKAKAAIKEVNKLEDLLEADEMINEVEEVKVPKEINDFVPANELKEVPLNIEEKVEKAVSPIVEDKFNEIEEDFFAGKVGVVEDIKPKLGGEKNLDRYYNVVKGQLESHEVRKWIKHWLEKQYGYESIKGSDLDLLYKANENGVLREQIDRGLVMYNRFGDLPVDEMLANIDDIYEKNNLGKVKNKFDLLRMETKDLLSYLRKIQKNLEGKNVDDTVKQVKKLKRWAKAVQAQGPGYIMLDNRK